MFAKIGNRWALLATLWMAASLSFAQSPTAVVGSSTSALPKTVEWRSIGSAAILYDAPSNKAKPLYIAPKGMPVQVLLSLNTFYKIRDVDGTLAWVEKNALVTTRTTVTRQEVVLTAQPSETAAAVLTLASGVGLELVDPPAPPVKPETWIKVRYRPQLNAVTNTPEIIAYTKASGLWGL